MVRSGLPLPSLLCLFGALLRLSPELVMAQDEPPSVVPVTFPGVQTVLAFAVEQYNQDRVDDPKYFKVLRVVKVEWQPESAVRFVYNLTLDLVRTKCGKEGNKIEYKEIQKCKKTSGNYEERKCSFQLGLRILPRKVTMKKTVCP